MAILILALMAVGWLAVFALVRRAHRSGRLSEDLHLDVAALGLLAALTGVFFWRLLSGGAWMPEGGGDMASFLLPMYRYAAESLRAAQMPLWNPYLYGGAPFAADMQSGLFYPPNLAAFLLVPRLTIHWMEALSAAHYVVAGAGMYCLLRFMRPRPDRIARPAAFMAGVVFMWSDLFVIHFGNTNLIAVAAWLPWSFLGMHRAMESVSARKGLCWAAAAAIPVALAGLGGHAQPLAYTLMALALYAVVHAVGRVSSPGLARSVASDLGLAATTVLLGLGLAAVALVPAAELVGLTRRSALAVGAAAEFSLQPELLIGLLAPGVFGRGMQQYWGTWPRVETGYVGVTALALAIVALALWVRRGRSLRGTPIVYFTLLAGLSLLLALGDHTPLFGMAHRWFPGIAGMRAPARFVYLLDFALAALAGLGLHGLLKEPRTALAKPVRAALLAVVLVGLAVAAPGLVGASRDLASAADERLGAAASSLAFGVATLATVGLILVLFVRGRVRRRVLGPLLIGVVVVELFATGSSLDWVDWDPTHNLDPPAMVFLKDDPGLYRVEVRPEVWGWWSPDATLVHQEYDVGGVYNPLQLADYQLVWESLTDRAAPLYDFLNAKYVVGPKDFALPWDQFVPVHDADEHVNIYLNLEAMPRAVAVRHATFAPDHEAAWEAIRRPGFDPAAEVVLELVDAQGETGDGGEIDSPSDGPAAPESEAETWSGPIEIDITGYRANSLEVSARLPDAGYLVLSENYYPGWRATVDGEPAEILRANYAFRAVAVPEGEHQVRLSYRPTSVMLGLVVSLASAALLAGAFFAGGCGRRKGPRDPEPASH